MADEATIRRYRETDAADVARIFNERYGGSVGPIEITPESWHGMYTKGWWNCPSLADDPDCVQVAERSGQVVGYVAFRCMSRGRTPEGMLQELVVSSDEAGAGLAERLLEHAEKMLAGRGVTRITVRCHEEDGPLWALLDAADYGGCARDRTVFMLAVVDLAGLLQDLAPRLAERARAARESGIELPMGLTLRSPGHSAAVSFGGGDVEVSEGVGDGGDASMAVELSEEALVGLVTGTASAEYLYLDGSGSMRIVRAGPAGRRAVELLGVLFPRVPRAVIAAHTW